MIDLHRRDGRMLRIGHRGAAALAPENTIESLRLALELGCDLVEFDVHDVDGTLVLVHDQPAGPRLGTADAWTRRSSSSPPPRRACTSI